MSSADDGADVTSEVLRWGTPAARWVLLSTILASGMAFLDGTVVNVALPALGRDLGADVSGLQWVLNGYMLTLASLILLAGSLGDRLGRRRVFLVGVGWFAAASLLCGLAPNVGTLVAARTLQGIGGALLTPGSLAILDASFARADRPRAIGAWSGLSGVFAAVGPLLGGWLVDVASWRLVFLINLPAAVVVVYVGVRHIPESFDPTAGGRLDVAGAVLGAAGLAGVTYALIEAPGQGVTSPVILAATALGVASMAAFVLVEARRSHPMLPLEIFSSRQFTSANVVTFAMYGALSGVFFLLILQLIVVLGYSETQAGVASAPVTLLMLLLSARAGAVAQRIGPRLPMSAGPLLIAAGILLMLRIAPGATYVSAVLPAVVVFGLGLSLTVAPLTATVLAAADERHAGVASGVNNAVARAAGLLAVAVLPAVAGLSGEDYQDPQVFAAGFRVAMIAAAALAAAAGVAGWLTIRNDVLLDPGQCRETHCAVGGPPLRKEPAGAVR